MRPTPGASDRSLAPREHGAYGQLFVPLLAALAMGRPGVGAIAIALVGVAVFFAHEPMLVLVGRRGGRARRESGAPARTRLAWLGALALAAGGAAVGSAPAGALPTAAPLLPATALLAWLVLRGDEKTAAGELLAAGTLAGVAVPVAVAGGVPMGWALGAWLAWMLAFGASTLAVRAVIAHAKKGVPLRHRALPPALAIVLAIASCAFAPWWCAAAAAPMLLAALALTIAPPPPAALRRVGWTLVASSVAAAAILITAARLAA